MAICISGLSNSLHTIKLVKKSGRFMLDAFRMQIPDLINLTEATFDKEPSAQEDIQHFSTFALVKTAAALSTHKAYISGYPGGLFKPENCITRAEMAAMLAKAVDLKETAEAHRFSDVPAGHWAAEAIAKASRMGLMQGYADDSFKPEQPVTRAEITAIAVKLMKSAAGQQGAGFSDSAGHWAEQAIRAAQAAGIVSGYADGKFRSARLRKHRQSTPRCREQKAENC
ncbi:S-layer homology domain-containing protein [Paenibacillus sp. FSL K6-2441]|uniref:S-layer homology domain-containing protein n=1 Tax=Paenibacillus TaxID=44249 RepID=UPI0030D7E00C